MAKQDQQTSQASAPQAQPVAEGHVVSLATADTRPQQNGASFDVDALAQALLRANVTKQAPEGSHPIHMDGEGHKKAADIKIQTLRRLGYWQEALKMEGKAEKATFLERVGARADAAITWRSLGYMVAGAAGVYLVYEGLAVGFDWPSFELVFKKNPITVMGPTSAPNGAVPLKR